MSSSRPQLFGEPGVTAMTTHSSGCESKRALASKRSSDSTCRHFLRSSISSTGRQRLDSEMSEPTFAQALKRPNDALAAAVPQRCHPNSR